MSSLSDRKKSILRAVCDEYIETAEPISSKEIQKKHLPDCSSATIRNELSALESMGYLVQPHISAGRVPSEKAFRLYVDELMELAPLTKGEIELIDRYFTKSINGMEEIVQSVAKVLSDVTNYPSVVIKQHKTSETVQSIRLLKLYGNSVLVVVITEKTVYKDSIIEISSNYDARTFNSAELWLNKIFYGKSIFDIIEGVNSGAISEDFAHFREIYQKVLEIIIKMANGKSEVITEGAGKILENPEYSNASAAKSFLDTMGQKEQLAQMLGESTDGGVNVKIGAGEALLADCAVVSTKMSVGDTDIGSVGVIGPMRMNYKKVVSVLDHIGRLLDNILKTEVKEEQNDTQPD